MLKYLVRFSYVGTRFRGAQIQGVPGSSVHDYEDTTTVQGLFNIAFRRLKPANEPVFTLSSRTDSGVHALGNTGHVELLHPRHDRGVAYHPDALIRRLNKFFVQQSADICVHSLQPVAADFHARHHASQRCYLYRLGVLPAEGYLPALVPATERHRCGMVRRPFCEDSMRECARLLCGTHDFRSFMGTPKSEQADLRTVRDLEVEVLPGVSPGNPALQVWDLHFRSRGFLFRQVRRTVGVLAAVARGTISLDEVRYMLEVPSKDSWNPRASTAAAHGLYLREVCYPAECLREESGSADSAGGARTPEPTDSSAASPRTVSCPSETTGDSSDVCSSKWDPATFLAMDGL